MDWVKSMIETLLKLSGRVSRPSSWKELCASSWSSFREERAAERVRTVLVLKAAMKRVPEL